MDSFQVDCDGASGLQVLWEDSERVFCRGVGHADTDQVLAVVPAAEHPSPAGLDRLAHEFGLKDELDAAWALRPLELKRDRGRTMLVLENSGGEPLARLLGSPMEVPRFLRLAIGTTAALGKVHQHGLIHRDIKPANIMVGCADGHVRLTGFGIASRLPRERQAPEAPETIAGTLPYMAPEQTGRMNRSIDARSDLYALGVTLYEMLTGALPFTASDPMEWVHCHIARQPIPPSQQVPAVPAQLSAIVMKLLAKIAEERYQTAAGVEADLRRCLSEWEAHGRIDPFPLGTHDVSDRLLMPEKLYGRKAEIDTLIAAFDRVVANGTPELVLVSGYSGIGKSSVVNEVHKELVPRRSLFASGKFDQYKRNIPYATVAQAFQGLVRQILGKDEVELARWREALREALGPNGQLMINLVPDLALIIGEQPPVPDLPPQDAHNRFQLVFRRFLGVFAQPEHPLALFLDDLQWLDAATLELIKHLVAHPEVGHLLLIGAYRDNEVGPAHPLKRALEAIRGAGASVQEIVLAPLRSDDVARLLADAMHMEPERTRPLAELVFEKTAGNPFFTIQFVTALADERLLALAPGSAAWSWNLARIRTKGFTDNVVDLMAAKLGRLPRVTRKVLGQLACLGNVAETATLVLVHGGVEEALHVALWDAARAGLVLRSESTYTFVHDRVQEGAYALIPEGERPAAHLRIGRLLAAHTPPEKREEVIFDIVNQLNRGASLITSQDEREQLAELNLLAGKRAKASAAYASALTYFIAGAVLLPEDAGDRQYELTFALELNRAECEFLTAALAQAEERLAALVRRARSLPDLAAVTRLLEGLFVTVGRNDCAVKVCLDYLRHTGVEWLAYPTKDEVRQEYEQIWHRLGDRPIEALLDLPRMTDPGACATMDVLLEVVSPALLTDENLLCLVVCRMANLSLEHGNNERSCSAYVWLGMILGRHLGDYQAGFRFGQLGLNLVEQRGLDRFKARVYMLFGNHVVPWTRHVRAGRPLVRRAVDAATQVGDLTYAGYGCINLTTNLLTTGDPLGEVQREAEAGLDFARQVRFGLAVDIITVQLQLIRTLRGLTPNLGHFNDAGFDEGRFEQEEHLRLSIAACWYWIRKLQARFFAGDYAAAFEAASNARRLLWTSTSCLEVAEYHFYAALARAAHCDAASAAERTPHLEALADHHRQLQEWATNCPDNFENRAALVGAEMARIEGRTLEAMNLYEQAIRSAQANGFVQNEGLAYELAARFYATRGFEAFANAYLRNARYCYLRWGADGKVQQLDAMYPHIRTEEPAPAPTSTIAAPVEHLDLATVIKVSQAVSGEIVLEKLLITLMRTAIEQAGAERGLLILPQGSEQRLAAEATVSGDSVSVRLSDECLAAGVLPETVLHYVLRTRESVILDDAAASPFADDEYIRQRQARSVLCLPLLNQAKIIGVLFLENNLAPCVFAPARIAVLKLLASQAAISLENTRLYRDLAEREARIRRLVDSDVIGIVIWDLDGRLIDANDAFLRMVQYEREDLSAGLRWLDMAPPEWQEAHVLEEAEELKATGMMQAREKELFRKDGRRVPVLIGAAAFDGQPNQGVAYVLDLTERKRAEEAARDSERRYREVQMELAHANRLATMGQLTASITHEMRQPIAASVTSAEAGLRWLDRPLPDLEAARQAFDRIVQNGKRASDVIGGIRALVKKASPRQDLLEINGLIREVIELTHSEAMKSHVSVKAELAEGLPLIRGDRVQLQQVMLNLIINAIEAVSGISDGARELLISTGKAESGDVLAVVRDSGPGLAPAARERIFEAFYTTKTAGLGLGLSICHSIIEAHGGRVWASANEPWGAAFQFTLPPWPGAVPAEQAAQRRAGASDGSGTGDLDVGKVERAGHRQR